MSARRVKTMLLAALVLGIGAAGGYWFAQQSMSPGPEAAHAQTQASTADERKVLYWYDPMVPQQKFDQPGKSPFMDMQLVPRYADEGGDSAAGIPARRRRCRAAPSSAGSPASRRAR